jgi:hypothetical protein
MTAATNTFDQELTEAEDLSHELRDEDLDHVVGGNMRHEMLKAVANNLRG